MKTYRWNVQSLSDRVKASTCKTKNWPKWTKVTFDPNWDFKKLVIAVKKRNEHLHRTNSLENKMTKWNSRSWFEGRQLLLLLSVLAKRLNSCENSDPLESRNDQQILSTTATTSTTATATTAGPGPRPRPRQRQELQRWLPVGREHPERLGKVEAAAVVSKVRPSDVDEIERAKAQA